MKYELIKKNLPIGEQTSNYPLSISQNFIFICEINRGETKQNPRGGD